MDKNQGIPTKKVPIIGEKAQIQGIIQAIVNQLKPQIDIILTSVEALEHRMNVVEEVKQVFPASINVIIKKEKK